MNKRIGYVTFIDREINEGQELNEDTIVFPTLEDSLKNSYLEDNKTIAKVSYAEFKELGDSEYYGYYNMRLINHFKIEKILDHKMVMDLMCNPGINEMQLKKFIRSFKLTDEDKKRIIKLGPVIKSYIQCYQPMEKSKVLVKNNGKHSN